MSRRYFRSIAATLTMSMLGMSVQIPTASAAIISTQALAEQQQDSAAKTKINTFLAREDVRRQLMAYGVDPQQAQDRVKALNDNEAQRLAAELDKLPAGGMDFIGAVVFVFLVLLLTDILGLTQVFPFVRHTSHR
jgi:hypothetical protein